MTSLTLYPAIDILGGKCVRLRQGDYNQDTVYHESPIEVAQKWASQGAAWIHLVDLDGAKEGKPVNAKVIGEIARTVGVPVQVGGGLRNRASIDKLIEAGVSRVILGTAAIENKSFVREVLQVYGDQVAIGIDARDGYVATRGWLETSQVTAEALAQELVQYGARTFIFTDISRDGMMQGPNIASIVKLAQSSGQQVIASGGVSSYDDLEKLAKHVNDGVVGAIIGKALYTGDIVLEDALARLKH